MCFGIHPSTPPKSHRRSFFLSYGDQGCKLLHLYHLQGLPGELNRKNLDRYDGNLVGGASSASFNLLIRFLNDLRHVYSDPEMGNSCATNLLDIYLTTHHCQNRRHGRVTRERLIPGSVQWEWGRKTYK